MRKGVATGADITRGIDWGSKNTKIEKHCKYRKFSGLVPHCKFYFGEIDSFSSETNVLGTCSIGSPVPRY